MSSPSSRAQHVVVQPHSSSLVDVVQVVMAWYLPPLARVDPNSLSLANGLLDVSVPRVQLEDLLASAAILGLV